MGSMVPGPAPMTQIDGRPLRLLTRGVNSGMSTFSYM